MKAVIFDLDGVLTSTDKYHYEAWKKVCDQNGLAFDEEFNHKLRGVGRIESFNLILAYNNKTMPEKEKQALIDQKNEYYVELLKNMSHISVDQDIWITLEELKKRHIKVAVASSSKNTKTILEKCGLTNHFHVICDGTMVSRTKPDPEIFLLAASKLGVEPYEAIVVEDAVRGIDAANAGGFISCAYGKAAKEALANFEIGKVSDIIKIVDELNEGVVIEDNEPIFNENEEAYVDQTKLAEKEFMNSNEHTIVIDHLTKVYPGNVKAVDDFNLVINPGEFVVFVGPSGCGKSTVLRMIAGLEEISGGQLYIDDVVMNDTEPKDRDIAMVFQNYALYPHKTVRENIGFALYMEKIPFKHFFDFKWRKERKAQIDRKVEEVAKITGLTEYLKRRPANLSGGQRQRVALGRAIIRNPKAFLLDEPLSNLDAKLRAEMRTEISRLHNNLKAIFIYVTHDQVEAMTMGSKIVVMKLGKIQQIGTPQEIYMNPVNTFVASFIGTPKINLFEAKLSTTPAGSFVEIGGYQFDLPESITSRLDNYYLENDVIVGVRPKAIHLDNEKGIKVDVNLCEQLGDEALVYFTFMNHEYVASLITHDKYEPNTKIMINLDLEHCCIFDKETEKSILK